MRAINYGAPGSTGFAKNWAGKFGGPGAGWRFGGNYGGGYYGAGRFGGAGGFGKFSAGNAMAFGGAGGFSGMPKGMKGAARFQYLQTVAAASNPPPPPAAESPAPNSASGSTNSPTPNENSSQGTFSRILNSGPRYTINGTDNPDYLRSDPGGYGLIQGLGGNDTLESGGAWFDTLLGGDGNDLFLLNERVRTDLVGVVLSGGVGRDTLESATVSVNLNDLNPAGDIEDIVLSGDARHARGNSLDNLIVGNEYGNQLFGGSGSDTLVAGGVSRPDDLFQLDHDRLIGGDGGDIFDLTGAYPQMLNGLTFYPIISDFDSHEGDRLLLPRPNSLQEYRIEFTVLPPTFDLATIYKDTWEDEVARATNDFFRRSSVVVASLMNHEPGVDAAPKPLVLSEQDFIYSPQPDSPNFARRSTSSLARISQVAQLPSSPGDDPLVFRQDSTSGSVQKTAVDPSNFTTNGDRGLDSGFLPEMIAKATFETMAPSSFAAATSAIAISDASPGPAPHLLM